MKSHFSLFVFGFILLMDISCKKKCVKNDILYTVSEKTKIELPYTGFDTLIFVRTTQGDTHTFVGQGINKSYKFKNDAYDCSPTYSHEVLTILYRSKTFNNPIYFQYNTKELTTGEHRIDFGYPTFTGSLNFNAWDNSDSL